MAGLHVDVTDLAKAATAAGVEIVCSTGLSADADISSPDPRVRAAGREHLRRCLYEAAELGPDPRRRHIRPMDGIARRRPRRYRHRSAAELSVVAEEAASLGLVVCLEVLNRFETSMFDTVAECLAFIDEIGHPAVRVQVDTFHMNMEEDDLAAAIRLAVIASATSKSRRTTGAPPVRAHRLGGIPVGAR